MKKKSLLILMGLSLLVSSTLKAQSPKEQLDKVLSQTFQKHNIPGVSVAIINKDKVLYQHSFGYANIATKTPYTQQTIHNIGSTSKTFIGVSIMQLVEQGKLSLDTEINQILPFSVIHPRFLNSKITIRHLVTHTSGIKDHYKSYGLKAYTSDDSAKGNRKGLPLIYKIQFKKMLKNEAISLGVYLQNVLSKRGKWYRKKNFTKTEPGTHYHYSNIGSALAGYIVEIVSGMSFAEYTQKNILQPLQMNASGWNYETVNMDNFANRYMNQIPVPKYNLITYPDGGLITSCADLSKYLMEMIKGYQGESELLTSSSFQTLMTNQFEKLPLSSKIQSKEDRIGIFWDIFGFEGIGDIGHSGSDPGILSFMYFDPISGIGCILLTNTDAHKDHQKVVNMWQLLIKHRDKFKEQ